MRTIIYVLFGTLCVSCASDLHFDLPQGPEGPAGTAGAAGKSAYEMWLEAVKNKTIAWTDPTGLDDFFRYLKGTDGTDGIDGIDGVDGKSAYDLWLEQVALGIDDPHDPGNLWDRSRTELVHFYQYLTGPAGKNGINGINGTNGKDGKNGLSGREGLSAYELWLNLLEIPGAIEWDGGTTLIEFLQYLKGKDGKDGEKGLDGLSGSNGLDGEKGADGLSAYELWTADVEAGVIEWPRETTTYADFWEYLKGEPGNDGNDGQDGQDGQSAYDLWVEMVKDPGLVDPKTGSYWPADQIGVVHFYRFLTGADGINGKDGIDGADGINGNPGQSAYALWCELVEGHYIAWDGGTEEVDFFLYLKGQDGQDGQNGIDGLNGRDGQDGVNGLTAYELWLADIAQGNIVWDGLLTLEGFWDYLKGRDGQDGQDGQDGASAYALWVQYVADGIPDPHNPGANWPEDKVTMADFYAYLTGQAGKDGVDGADGETILLVVMEGLIRAYYTWVADVEARRTPVPWPKGSTAFDKFLEYCQLDNSYLTSDQP